MGKRKSMLIFRMIWIGLFLVGLFGFMKGAGGKMVPFNPDEQPDLLALAQEAQRDSLAKSLITAGGNWEVLANALRRASPEMRPAVVGLILRMPPVDRAEITSEALLDHVCSTLKAKSMVPYPVPEEMFLDYVLNFRLDFEPVEAWREQLFDLFYPMIEGAKSAAEAARIVNRWIAERMSEIPPQEIRQTPLVTLRGGKGSAVDLCILTGAALRAVGIPTRMAYIYALGEDPGGTGWLEVFVEDRWNPVYPLEAEDFGNFVKIEVGRPHNVTRVSTVYGPCHEGHSTDAQDLTVRYTETGQLVVDVKGKTEDDRIGISVFNDGSWIPIVAEAKPGTFMLGDGEYLVTAGRRDQQVVVKRVNIRPDETTQCIIELPAKGM